MARELNVLLILTTAGVKENNKLLESVSTLGVIPTFLFKVLYKTYTLSY
jgi:hypothetical protein